MHSSLRFLLTYLVNLSLGNSGIYPESAEVEAIRRVTNAGGKIQFYSVALCRYCLSSIRRSVSWQ
jgi:hypothetical protein